MRLPLTIVGGFLGAGKTTLIQRLLLQADGRRIAVLVNDFGKLNIDASLLARSGADTLELSNGCVCCSIGDDLNAALIQLESRAGDFDHVVIEASGVSDPWKIAQIGLVNAGYRLDGIVVLVDASAVQELLNSPRYEDTVLRQCRRADLLLLNKMDVVAATGLDVSATTQTLTKRLFNGMPFHGQVLACSQADVPIDALLGSYVQPSQPAQQWGESFKAVSKPKWQSLSLVSTQTWTRSQFESCLTAVPASLVRGKAILPGHETSGGWLEWHRVCGRDTWLVHTGAAPVKQSVLVLIGLDEMTEVDSEKLRSNGWV